MVSVLLSSIGYPPYGKCSTSAQLDAYFTNLVDLLPPECYFDTESLGRLRSAGKVQLQDNSKIADVMTVSQCAQVLESLEQEEKLHSTTVSEAKLKLQNRIQQLKAGRKSKDEDPLTKKERRAQSKVNDKKKKKKSPKANPLPPNNNKASAKSETPSSSSEAMPLFSRFNFMNGQDDRKDNKRKLTNEQLLRIAEKRTEKIEAVRQQDSNAARQIESKDAWKRALDKAKGVKVKDDPKYLKKAIRKTHSLKRRSARKWSERNKQEESKKADRQAKRQRNLDKAKAQKSKAKMKRAVAKGHVLPGF